MTIQSESEQVLEALSKSVMTMDSARRVAWAKAFNALDRVEALEEEVRIMRDERIALRRAYSRLLGFVQHMASARSEVMDRELAAHIAAERTFRHDDAWDKGCALGREHEALVKEWTEEHRVRVAERRVANKIKHQERLSEEKRAAKAAMAAQFQAARDAGHEIDKRLHGERSSAKCSCGWSSAGAEHDVRDATRAHAGSVLRP